jgi:hypothetical protein
VRLPPAETVARLASGLAALRGADRETENE